ncbi:MAG TPA: FAD-dependent oxidoreductase [Thermoleophilaceae bacterium]
MAGGTDTTRSLTRRGLLGSAAAAGAAGALARPGRAHAARRDGRSVAVLGGGIGGLSAAHELVERGFRVTVYEHGALGGKARSIPVPGSGSGGRRDLPGEHGYRFFPGFYRHLPDTMRRIPFGKNAEGVFENLVEASQAGFARNGGREDLIIPLAVHPWTPQEAAQAVVAGFAQISNVPPEESAYFGRKLSVFMSSSDERRLGEWERQSWWNFVGADRFSDEYKRFFGAGIARNFAAAKPESASARTIGLMAEQIVYQNAMKPRGEYQGADRVLNGPTSEAWLDPWVAELRRRGVTFKLRRRVMGLDVRKGKIAGVRLRGPRGDEVARADWYFCALPVEQARKLWSPAVLAADPRLAGTGSLVTDWMTGIQFYLDRELPILHGHVSYVDSPWALTSISQQQFWTHDFAKDGDGRVRDCLSVVISDWHTPGILYGKPARELRPEQIAEEVWAQIKGHLNDTGRDALPDGARKSWFLDPAIGYRPGDRVRARNATPLLINTVETWAKRPDSVTGIHNLFLASDYPQTNTDIACMESANESARRAVNGLLARAGSQVDPCAIFKLWQPPEFEPAKQLDAERYARGEPNLLDL